jgi:hypothetical protein
MAAAMLGHMPAMNGPARSIQKQKAPFDARLLCAKLEAHQRELDLQRARREQREAPKRRSMFFPQTAARQFAATTTCMPDMPVKRSNTTRPVVSLPMNSEPQSMNPKQILAARSAGMSETEAVNAVSHANEPVRKRDSLSPISSSQQHETTEKPARKSSERRSDEGRRDGREEVREKRKSYHPGDAEKRRNEGKPTNYSDFSFGLQIHETPSFMTKPAVPAYRQARDADVEMPYGPLALSTQPEISDEPTELPRGRPRPQDRPNWRQDSTCGDETRDMLQRLHGSGKPTTTKARHHDARRAHSEHRTNGTSPEAQPRRGSENLISDAVKLIKEEKKVRKRESVFAFFKRSKS